MRTSSFFAILFVWLSIFLMVSLPVSASIRIGSVRIYGENGIENFRKKNDDYSEVRAVILNDESNPDPEITSDQVRFSSGMDFDECTLEAQGLVCTYRGARGNVLEDEFHFQVELFNDYAAKVDQETVSMYVDSRKPHFDYLFIEQDPADGLVKASVELTDEAFPGSGVCSGLKSLVIKENGQTIFNVDDFSSPSDYVDNPQAPCQYRNDTFVIPVSDSGMKTYSFTAVDRLGNRVSSSRTVDVDMSSASFSSMEVLDDQGEEVVFVRSGELYYVDVVVVLEADDSPDVTATFTDFDYLYPAQFKTGSCSPVLGGEYVCEFNDVNLRVEQSQTLAVDVEAVDDFHNTLQSTRTHEIIVDDDGPRINSFGTSRDIRDDQENIYVGSKATIVLDYYDAGVGVSAEDVLLSMGGAGINRRPADSCEESLSSCSWDVEVSEDFSSGLVRLHPDSSDRLSNRFVVEESEDRFEVFADTDIPYNVSPVEVFRAGSDDETLLVVGDSIDITVVLNDSKNDGNIGMDPDNVLLNLSKFVSSSALMPASCGSGAGDSIECRWSDVGPLEDFNPSNNEPRTEAIEIYAHDKVGNRLVKEHDIVVYLNPDEDRDWWKHIVPYPSTAPLDVQIMELISLSFPMPLLLVDNVCAPEVYDIEDGLGAGFNCNQKLDNLEVVRADLEPASCKVVSESSNPDGEDAIQGFKNIFESEPPYRGGPHITEMGGNTDRLRMANFLLKQTVPEGADGEEIDWIVFNCTLDIKSENNGYLYSEKEPFMFNLSFTKTALGNLPEEVEEEAQNARDRANSLLQNGLIDAVGGFIEMVQNVCSIFTTLSGVVIAIGWLVDGAKLPFSQTLGAGVENAKYGFVDSIIIPACRLANCEHCKYDSDSKWWPTGGSEQFDTSEWGEGACADYGSEEDGEVVPDDDGLDVCKWIRLPLCTAALNTDFTDDWGDGRFSMDTSLNPKESFGLSLMTLCLPGIITGLRNRRHLECQYIKCLEQDVPQGEDPMYCKAERTYNMCVWWGEGFYFITYVIPYLGMPFSIVDVISSAFEQVMLQPLGSLFGITMKFVCTPNCVSGTGCGVCTGIQVGERILGAVNTFWHYKENWDGVNTFWPGSPCNDVFEENEEDEERD